MNILSLRRKEGRNKQAGFTLIEIMIVMAIVMMLAGLVGSNVMKNYKKSQKDGALLQVKAYESALDSFYMSHGQYPTTDQGLKALIEAPNDEKIRSGYPSEGYLKGKKLPLDPWGEEYLYEGTKDGYVVSSKGPDKESGTDDDIRSDK